MAPRQAPTPEVPCTSVGAGAIGSCLRCELWWRTPVRIDPVSGPAARLPYVPSAAPDTACAPPHAVVQAQQHVKRHWAQR